jgi:uncharacterized phage protein (TIGR02218 family)
MSYSAIETSVHSGAPAELYLFSYDGQNYSYTSSTRTLIISSQTYVPAVIERDKIVWNMQLSSKPLLLTVTSDFPPALFFKGFPPETDVGLTIFRYHITDTAKESIILWKGRVRGVTWQESGAIMTCDNFISTLSKTGPRLQYQYMCNHVLYGIPCGISAASFSTDVTLYNVSGVNLYSTALAGYADDWFKGGYVRFGKEYRMITYHVGDRITIAVSLSEVKSNSVVKVTAGCGHTFSICETKFSNYTRYGGFPFVPNRNPFIIGVN